MQPLFVISSLFLLIIALYVLCLWFTAFNYLLGVFVLHFIWTFCNNNGVTYMHIELIGKFAVVCSIYKCVLNEYIPGFWKSLKSMFTSTKCKTIGQCGSVGCLNIYNSFIPSRSNTVTSMGGNDNLFSLAHFSARRISY